MENKKFAVVIQLAKYINWFKAPRVGEYDNPYVKKITPCTVNDNGEYFSWETGERVKPSGNFLVWNLSVGTMFKLKDEREVLITRDFAGNRFLVEGVRFNPASMVRYEAK